LVGEKLEYGKELQAFEGDSNAQYVLFPISRRIGV
jgi:hypothetical protein